MFNLTILMPCLNEEENIAYCIEQALDYLRSRGLAGEVLVVDNDSIDKSAEIASAHGATVAQRTPAWIWAGAPHRSDCCKRRSDNFR